MHRLAKRFLSFTMLAAVLAGAAGPASAQSFEQLADKIDALDLPNEKGLLHLITSANILVDNGKLMAATHVLDAVATTIESQGGIDPETVTDLIASVDAIIAVLEVGPQHWWCDYDGDGYTVYLGKFALPPSEYCHNSPLFGSDSDDNNPYITN